MPALRRSALGNQTLHGNEVQTVTLYVSEKNSDQEKLIRWTSSVRCVWVHGRLKSLALTNIPTMTPTP